MNICFAKTNSTNAKVKRWQQENRNETQCFAGQVGIHKFASFMLLVTVHCKANGLNETAKFHLHQ